jgi:hypothetical protein
MEGADLKHAAYSSIPFVGRVRANGAAQGVKAVKAMRIGVERTTLDTTIFPV